VTTVPGRTPTPVKGMPIVTLPDEIEETVSVLPDIDATIVGGEGGIAAESVVVATDWGTLTEYVPAPPLPVPIAVTTVPAAMPGPTTGEPMERAPDVTELTVRVVPEMEPVKDAAELVPTTLAVATFCVVGAATVYVPTPPAPVPSAVTTVPGTTPGPVTGVPTAMAPAVIDDTVIVFPEIDALNTGATGGAAAADITVVVMVWGTLTVYVPAPPLPVPTAVTTVPAAMPGPTTGEPTVRAPDVTELTVRVVPEMEPVKDAAVFDATTLVLATVCVVGAATVYVPSAPVPVPSAVTTVPGTIPGPVTGVPTAMAPAVIEDTVIVFAEIDALNTGATGGALAAVAVVVVTVWGRLTKYVPAPPVPVPTAVTTVPAAMPGPTIGEPTVRAPDVTELTVRVVPEMDPVNVAAGLAATKLVVATFCVVGAATVYVPTPPAPDSNPVTTVPGRTPEPDTGMPTVIAPSVAADTESVLPEIDPTTVGAVAVMAVLETVCEGLTVYVPTPPLPNTTPVTTVPATIPWPTMLEPTAREPDAIELTVSVLPEMEPDNCAEGAAAIAGVLATVCETLTVYVPAPPPPVPTAVTTVPAAMPGPTTGEPTAREPDVMELTVRVVPEIEPVKAAVGGAIIMLMLSTDCVEGAATVYVPTPPLPVPPSAVTTVPGTTPGPVMGVPTAMVVPGDTDDTERVLPEMEATTAGAAGGATADTAAVDTVCGMLTV